MGFGQNSDRPVFAVGFDHGKRFGFGGVEHGDGFLDVHDRMQHHVAMMENAGKALGRLDIRRVRFGDEREPGIAARAVDRDHPGF